MIDIDTFLTTLYVLVDDFFKEQSAAPPAAGRPRSLTVSEVVTLAIFSQWYPFRSERDFYRWAKRHLRSAFPNLPHRAQYNRSLRSDQPQIEAFSLSLVTQLHARNSLYEILDTTGIPVRNAKRRGAGWLGGQANVGKCTRLGWYDGFRLLISVNRQGAITGYGFGAGSAKEQPLTEAFLAVRAHPHPRFASVGQPALGAYLTDKGFAGPKLHQHWKADYGAEIICEPQTKSPPWPAAWQGWLRHYRQIVESSYAKLIDFFRLEKSRPHDLRGFQAGLAAKIALHNFCMWLNQQMRRPLLAFSDLLDW